jgi:hypothetical protein
MSFSLLDSSNKNEELEKNLLNMARTDLHKSARKNRIAAVEVEKNGRE